MNSIPGPLLSLTRVTVMRGDRAALEEYLDRHCRRPQGLADYLETIGMKRLLELHEY